MRIAFLTTEYITEKKYDGGLANYLSRISKSLVSRDHSIEIFTQSETNGAIIYDNILVHRIRPPYKFLSLFRWTDLYSAGVLHILVMGWLFRSRLLHRHRIYPFDIVQAASYQSTGLGLAQFSPVPLVVRVSSYAPILRVANNLNPLPPSRACLLAEKLERYVLRRANMAYAPSKCLAEILRKDLGINVEIIRPPYDVNVDTRVEGSGNSAKSIGPYLLYFGRVNVLKGLLVLAEALKDLLPRFPDMHVVLAGQVQNLTAEQTVLDYIYQQAGDHAGRIHYWGRLTHDQLFALISDAVGVVFPSLVDNLPNACLESMALAKPIIGTRGASFEEMIEDGVSGMLVPPGDSVALAGAMERLWTMPDNERMQIGHAARRALSPFSPAESCQHLEKRFSLLIKAEETKLT